MTKDLTKLTARLIDRAQRLPKWEVPFPEPSPKLEDKPFIAGPTPKRTPKVDLDVLKTRR
jgi:hypothetical protein